MWVMGNWGEIMQQAFLNAGLAMAKPIVISFIPAMIVAYILAKLLKADSQGKKMFLAGGMIVGMIVFAKWGMFELAEGLQKVAAL